MADFHQTGIITTLHRLGSPGLERLEAELEAHSRKRPVALVLPALYAEFEGQAMPKIVAELAKVRYLGQIVVALGRASESQYRAAADFLKPLGDTVRILHIEGKPVQELLSTLEAQRRQPRARTARGGRPGWPTATSSPPGKADIIALHDCDILTYNRELLARLCYPVVHPDLDYVFCKGFYSRVTDKLHGRVTRLLITPLMRSLIKLVGEHPFLVFLDSFRYPLAGEFCMMTDVARVNRIPWDWGLEVGVLAEVLPQLLPAPDLPGGHRRELRAQAPGPLRRGPRTGLMRMSVDICKSLFRTLASEGVVFSDGFFKSLQVTYLRMAEDTIMRYEADAAINGLDVRPARRGARGGVLLAGDRPGGAAVHGEADRDAADPELEPRHGGRSGDPRHDARRGGGSPGLKRATTP